jgi:preprotein translocase subunit SecA
MPATVSKILTKVFGSRNERLLKRYRAIVAEVNELAPEVEKKTDSELRARTLELREGLVSGKLRSVDALPEAFAIIRESMDRHIGIRSIFNPEENFDPDQFDDETLELYDGVQRHMITTGQSWLQVEIPPKIYDAVRKMYPESRPPFRARPFDVQLIGGLVLYEGKIAEMATGEGKTFVAPLACFMRVLEGYHCHVVTVNDYLVRRDALWLKPAFDNLGITVGFIQSDMDPGGDTRKQMYGCDITYGTNSEFGFDYLRDNMKERAEFQVQGPLDFAIVDEVDSILIDEARTPLIISGAAHDDAPKYRAADEVARKVLEKHKPYAAVERKVDAAKRAIKAAQGDEDKAANREEKQAARKRQEEAEQQLQAAEAELTNHTQYYEVELDRKSVHLTHEGIAAAQDAAGVGSFYVGNNMEWPHLMEQALRAHVVYEKDKDYMIAPDPRSNEMSIIIVDEYTGRPMYGRQWSDGLHQAVEAKERVPIKQETQTLATITLQNFFKLYKSLAGMTGTAMTEAEEFNKIYSLEVVNIPTNRPVIRADTEDRVYRTEREKWNAIVEEIKQYSDACRPILIGTTSVEKSEMLSKMLTQRYGVKHEVLNAKQHEREAHIVAVAGHTHVNAHGEKVGNVTIATNMAGRGTDIKLAPETLFDVKPDGDKYVVKQRSTDKTITVNPNDESDLNAGAYQIESPAGVVGGLHVIGTERHTARRIDNQLRGRSGRQGDPGSSRFYVSLQDDLMKMFAGEWTIKVLSFLGMEEGMAIEDKRISKGILRAQKKVEERNFLARKNLLEYDEVNDYQRNIFYGMRQQVLEGRAVANIIWDMIGKSIEDAVDKYVTQDFVAATIAEWARVNFEVTIDADDIRGMRQFSDIEDYIKRQARTEVETNLSATLQEFMGEEPDDNANWDTKGLSSWAMSRFHVQISQAQLRKMSAFEVEEKLKEAALEQIEKRDCAGILKYLEPDYALRELTQWAQEKFGVTVTVEEMLGDAERHAPKPAGEIVKLIDERARAAYLRRELETPVDYVLMTAFRDLWQPEANPMAVDIIREWVHRKYRLDLGPEAVREQSIRQLRDQLLGYQERWLRGGELDKEVDVILASNKTPEAVAKAANQRFALGLTARDIELVQNGAGSAGSNGDADEPERPADVRTMLIEAGRRFLRKELTDLEQFVLIQIFDQSWKDHLYAMDMLKNGIGLQAFAERDPRIAYKKEGYQYFQEMMAGVRDKVTDLIFRARFGGAEQAPQPRSRYKETAAVHETSHNYGVTENLRETADVGVVAPVGGGETAPSGGEAQGEPAKVKTITREAPKVGRNDPCPCGSGKKYKKCCGAEVA